MPTSTQPWCSTGTIIVSSVDSWPPCIDEVEVTTSAGLQTSVQLAPGAQRPSMRRWRGPAKLPKRGGVANNSAEHRSTAADARSQGAWEGEAGCTTSRKQK